MSMENMIREMMREMGDNPTREGLMETPKRVIKSWEKLYGGYKVDIPSLFKTFKRDGYDNLVLLRDIEFFSTCEHHMLPFFGKAHIAYLPSQKVIGISKLARVLEAFSRRLQIQERIGIEVIAALDRYLKPLGSACILEAKHFCMVARGVEKQNSIMTTSALSGVFKTKLSAREELMRLIR